MNDSGHARPVRRLLLAWAALVALMLASLGSAYLPLGAGNLVAGVVIAAVKTGIVAWVFMRLCAHADANGDGLLNVNDIFYLINFLFAGGPAPTCY